MARSTATNVEHARVVSLAEIEADNWNLDIGRYVDTAEEKEEEQIGVPETVRKVGEPKRERVEAEATMNQHLTDLEHDA